ncbi:hypothetical protein [Saccharicrinis aurantiacus]|uniref:hypothetical protein n=1 Tax=Saccharicrinis aurantiacus TaxID=1849719 RepID=UPI0008394046|nr:hypothetical protein [Saccharicrinis aurantiacus]
METKLKKEEQYFKFGIIFLISGILLAFVLATEETNGVFNEFPPLKMNESINVIIDHYKDYKGTTLIFYYSNEVRLKKSLRSFSLDQNAYSLYRFLEKGDSISRKPYSDNLFLYKKKEGTVIEFEVQCLE